MASIQRWHLVSLRVLTCDLVPSTFTHLFPAPTVSIPGGLLFKCSVYSRKNGMCTFENEALQNKDSGQGVSEETHSLPTPHHVAKHTHNTSSCQSTNTHNTETAVNAGKQTVCPPYANQHQNNGVHSVHHSNRVSTSFKHSEPVIEGKLLQSTCNPSSLPLNTQP